MLDRVEHDGGIVSGFADDEGALQHGLRVHGEATGEGRAGGWVQVGPVCRERPVEVRRKGRSVPENACTAGVPNGWRGLEDLLGHGAHQTSVVGRCAVHQRGAQVEIAHDPLKRVGRGVVGRVGEEGAGRLAPVPGRRDGEGFFAREMVEEGALGDAGAGAQVIDTRGSQPARSDDGNGRVEQLRASLPVAGMPLAWTGLLAWVGVCFRAGGHSENIPTSRYALNGWLGRRKHRRV